MQQVWDHYLNLKQIRDIISCDILSYNLVALVAAINIKKLNNNIKYNHTSSASSTLMEIFLCDETYDNFSFNIWGSTAEFYANKIHTGSILLFYNCILNHKYRSGNCCYYGKMDNESSIHILKYSSCKAVNEEIRYFPNLFHRTNDLIDS